MNELDERPARANLFFAAELMQQWFQMMNLPQEEYHKMVSRCFQALAHSTRVSVEWHGNIGQIIRNPDDISHLPYVSDAKVYPFPKTYRFSQPK